MNIAPPVARARTTTDEQVIEFGPGRRLVGILTRPSAPVTGESDVALVLTNAGIIHRVGPNRLHVRLARHVAATGVPALRYDLPGLGDSEAVGVVDTAHSAMTATAAAMSSLQRMGVATRFVLFGICAGADHVLRVAAIDPRVDGVILVDPTTAFATPRHRLQAMLASLRAALRRPRVVVDWLSRHMRKGPPSAHPTGSGPRLLHARTDTTEWARMRETLTTFVARGLHLHVVVTRHNARVHSYPRQLHEAFADVAGLDTSLTCSCYPMADHTFTREDDRRQLEDELRAWLRGAVSDSGRSTR